MAEFQNEDVFEITDFTTATEWERFIAKVEEVLHEWKRTGCKTQTPLRKGDLSYGKWRREEEQLKFSSFGFVLTRCYLECEQTTSKVDNSAADVKDEELDSSCLLNDLENEEIDFPICRHSLSYWYGLRDFVILHPSRSEEAIATEDRAKLLLSSVAIAISNTGFGVPLFVQLWSSKDNFFLGVCEKDSIRTNFEMILFRRIPQKYSHLSGLLALFKSRLQSFGDCLSTVKISARFKYVMRDWSLYSWPQQPPDLDASGKDFKPSEIGNFPFGAQSEPIQDLHLFALWPSLYEDVVIDNEITSDLNPAGAPQWFLRFVGAKAPVCSMVEMLHEFAQLAKKMNSQEKLLSKTSENDEREQLPIQALDRLTQNYDFLNVANIPSMTFSARRRANNCKIADNHELAIKILQFIFPDSAPSWLNTEGSSWSILDNLPDDSPLHKLKSDLKPMKSAPPGSLTWRLALAMCRINYNFGGQQSVADLWRDFLQELRCRWDISCSLPCLEKGIPNLASCLLHQKLQMLNCCIERQKTRNTQERTPSFYFSDNDSDEEFYECAEEDRDKETDNDAKMRNIFAEGRLKRFGSKKLLNSPKQLYIPVIQEPSPMTEDMLDEQAEAFLQLGTHSEGSALRAKMQSSCLLSDMEAFKAANPDACLEDFIRWYSPRDWEETTEEIDGQTVVKGQLSQRMQVPGNTWSEAWENTRPIPVKRQKRLFDDTKEAERILHFLESFKPADVIFHLMPVLVHSAVYEIARHVADDFTVLIPVVEKATETAVKMAFSSEPDYREVLGALYQGELLVAQAQSLRKKLLKGITSHDNKTTVAGEQMHLYHFIDKLLGHPMIEVPEAGRGHVGKVIRNLLRENETQKPGQFGGMQDPEEREFILRAKTKRASPARNLVLQRMYCKLARNEFRVAGAFSRDTTFY